MIAGLIGGIILALILAFMPKREPKPDDGTNWPRLGMIAVIMLIGGMFLISLLYSK